MAAAVTIDNDSATPKWINVRDRLPRGGKQVHVVMVKGPEHNGTYDAARTTARLVNGRWIRQDHQYDYWNLVMWLDSQTLLSDAEASHIPLPPSIRF
jgi:hypothetical protein